MDLYLSLRSLACLLVVGTLGCSAVLELAKSAQVASTVEHGVSDGRAAFVARREEIGGHCGDDGGGGDAGRWSAERRQDTSRTVDDH